MQRFEIANRLVELRGNKSREMVADECGVSKRAIEAYETGYRIPIDEVKIKIANYYGVTVGYLFYGEN